MGVKNYLVFKTKNLKKYNKYNGYQIATCSKQIKIRAKKTKIRAKKKYKDTVFTKLFNNKVAAIQLYNALFSKNLPENTPVEIVTLDDALFTKRKNDVAFIVDGHFLIFIEHQSTINENMPLRLLLYVVQEYEKILGYRIIKGRQISNPLLYKKSLIKIPKPEFFVLYNGTKNLIETAEDTTMVVPEKIMRLSDAFIEDNGNPNSLELCVKVVDIRYNTNHQSLHKKSQQSKEANDNLSILGEYSYFINKVEEYKNLNFSLEEAIKTAAKHCIENDILKDFLLKNETEVAAMLLGTYNEEIEKQVLCEEAEARGVKIGEARGKARGIIDFALDLGYSSDEIIPILQKKLGITEQQAEDYLGRFYEGTL